MGVWYSTLEKVKASLEVNHTSRADTLIRPKIDGASRSVEDQMHRRFYPELRTVRFDYPDWTYSPTWRLWLGDNELASSDGLILQSGGVTIDNASVLLRRSDGKAEPPYTYLELRLDTDAAFNAGPTFQQATILTGLFGYKNEWSTAGGQLASSINSSVTTVDINPVSGELNVGVGSLIRVDDERMVVTNRRSLDTTVNTTAIVDDNKGETTIPVGDGSGFGIGEIILIDAERMRIVDIAGNNLIVERAFDGTVLDGHASGADVYAMRRYTVTRGALGSTAASHDLADTVSLFIYPGLVEELATAEATVMLDQSSSAYQQTSGAGDSGREVSGTGLPEIQKRCWTSHARKSRLGAI